MVYNVCYKLYETKEFHVSKTSPRAQRRVGSYRDAIQWIAQNDDNYWLDDDPLIAAVTLYLVADVFGRTIEEATADLRAELARQSRIDDSQ